jgi:hypothetical protein
MPVAAQRNHQGSGFSISGRLSTLGGTMEVASASPRDERKTEGPHDAARRRDTPGPMWVMRETDTRALFIFP